MPCWRRVDCGSFWSVGPRLSSSHAYDRGRQVEPNVRSMPIHYCSRRRARPSSSRSTAPKARNGRPTWRTSRRLREAWGAVRGPDDQGVGVGDHHRRGGVVPSPGAGPQEPTSPRSQKFPERRSRRRVSPRSTVTASDDGTRSVLRNWPLYKPIIAAVNGFLAPRAGWRWLGGLRHSNCVPRKRSSR